MTTEQRIAELMLDGWTLSTEYRDGTHWVNANKGGTGMGHGVPDSPRFMANFAQSVAGSIEVLHERMRLEEQ